MNKILKLILIIIIIFGHPIVSYATLPAGTVWEVRTTGSDANGGGFVAGGTGTDYSQQNGAQFSGTNLATTSGTTTPTVVTSATHNFVAADVGNLINISAGTNWTSGIYEIVSVSSNAATLDRAAGTSATLTGGTWAEGGAIATLNELASVGTAGNKAFVKATGTYTTTTSINFTAGYTSYSPFQIIGYNSTRGDNGRPTLQAQTNSGLTVITLSNWEKLRNFIIDCNSLATCTGVNIAYSGAYVYNVTVKNYSLYGFYQNQGNGGDANITFSEATGGTTSSSWGIYFNPSSGSISGSLYNNYVHDGVGSGIYFFSIGNMSNNIVANQSGASSDCMWAVFPGNVVSNILYNCGRDGLDVSFYNQTILNNIIVNNGRYGINNLQYFFVTVPAQPEYDGNAFYGNATANRNNMDSTTTSSTDPSGVNPYVNVRDVILTGNPFVNASSGNFGLNSTAGAGAAVRGAGIPSIWAGLSSTTGYPDFGAVQHQCSGSGGGSCAFIQ